MENGKLIVKRGKSGVYANIITSNGKTLTSLGGFLPDQKHLELNEKDIEFERNGGVVIKIVHEGNVIFDKAYKSIGSNPTMNKPKQFQKNPKQSKSPKPKYVSEQARAPYNFVPLNETIVEVDETNIDQSKYHSDKKTGYIDITITAKTPLYVRDCLTGEEIDKKNEIEEVHKKYTNSDFFSPTGKAAIPGSSLRGMIRTMVEILSYSKFGFTQEDRRLYYRTFADAVKGVREEYNMYMSSQKGEPKKMGAGILHKKGHRKYEIIPAGGVRKVFGEESKKLREKGKKIENVYRISNDEWIVSIKNLDGDFNNYYIKKEINEKPIPLDYESDIMDYKNDITRKSSIDVVKFADKHSFYPCFYVSYIDGTKTTRTAFGHNPYFRIPYKKTIDEHIIPKRDKSTIDFATSIFGDEQKFAGRVFFTDATMQKGTISPKEIVPKILSSPKPTTFQHYLEQSATNSRDERDTYNSSKKIRGNKLYWSFQSGNQWKAEKQDEILKNIQSEKSQYTLIKTAEAGSEFQGRIYFENITTKELGALLLAVDLQPNCYHKIGMGKPLGLGTISIKSEVYISVSQERYSSLESEWTEELKPIPEPDKNVWKDEFSGYIVEKLSEPVKKIWDLPRIQELVNLLQFIEDDDTIKNLDYMMINRPTGQKNPKTGKDKTVNEFRGRPILPKPSEIV